MFVGTNSRQDLTEIVFLEGKIQIQSTLMISITVDYWTMLCYVTLVVSSLVRNKDRSFNVVFQIVGGCLLLLGGKILVPGIMKGP